MVIKLGTFTNEELRAELARRAEVRSEPPAVLSHSMDFQPLINVCVRYIEELTKGDEGRTKDFDHYIYETAVEAVYGGGVWAWINEQGE